MSATQSKFFDLYPDMLCVATFDGVFSDLNPAWQKTLGWTSRELRAKPIFEWIHPEDRENIRNVFQSILLVPKSTYFEGRFLHRDGSFRYIFWSASVDMEAGTFLLSAREKTDFRNSFEVMRNSKQQFEAIFSSMLEGVAVQNTMGQILQYNQAALNILGVTADQLEGKKSFDPKWRAVQENGSIVASEQHPGMVAQRTGIPQKNKILGFQRPDGEIRWVSVTAIPLFEAGAKSSYQVIMTFHDITEEKNAREALARKDSEMSRIMNSLPAMVGYWDRDVRNVMANKWYGEVFGRDPASLKGMHGRDVVGAEIFDKYFDKIQGVLKGIPQSFEFEVPDAINGTRHMFALYLPDTRDGEIVGYYTIATDLTRIRELEKEHEEFQSKFIVASKMSALGEMAAGIAHEINNPLAIISGKTALLQTRIENDLYEPTRFVKDLKSINDTVERIAKTVRGLLAFSRNNEAENLAATNLQKIVESTLDLCREKMRNRGVELRLDLGAPVDIKCRSHQISQILMNLLNNASDAIDGKASPWIGIRVEVTSDKVRLHVSDSGNKIPSNIVEKIMNPFFTTKEIGKGTGLGLSISKGLAENHGGALTYDSNSLHTNFVLELPRVIPVALRTAI